MEVPGLQERESAEGLLKNGGFIDFRSGLMHILSLGSLFSV